MLYLVIKLFMWQVLLLFNFGKIHLTNHNEIEHDEIDTQWDDYQACEIPSDR